MTTSVGADIEFSEVAPDRRARPGSLIAVAVLVILAASLPFVPGVIPGLLPGPINSPGSLSVLAIVMLMAALAVSYDLVFGYTGLLSFGHAMFFAAGAYGTNVLMASFEMEYLPALISAVVFAAILAAIVGSVSLRASGIAFAMVTLAFAEAFFIFIMTDPLRLTGGEEGLPLAFAQVPDLFVGVRNTQNVYWAALAVLLVVVVVVGVYTRSQAGRVLEAIRENQQRVSMLGINPYGFKLTSFVVAGALAALVGGVYLLATVGANPASASPELTLTIVVMVVLGGAGRIWGAVIGGLTYGLLSLRLPSLGTSGALDGLPLWMERILAEPAFWMGSLFIVVVLVAPGGLAAIIERLRGRARREHTTRNDVADSHP